MILAGTAKKKRGAKAPKTVEHTADPDIQCEACGTGGGCWSLGQTEQPEASREKSRRGFASMDPEKQRKISQRGGKSAHARGTAYKFTQEERQRAGCIGGAAVSINREHMAEIGRRGGLARAKKQGESYR